MTPTVLKSVSIFPERAADYKWFDIAAIPEGRNFSHGEVAELVTQPMPFDKCAIAGVDEEGVSFALLLTKGTEGDFENAVCLEVGLQYERGSTAYFRQPAFWIRPNQANMQDGLEILYADSSIMKDKAAEEVSRVSVLVMAVFLETVHKHDTQYKMYTAVPKSNNAKRIRQGKKPMFDWHTVVIEPPKQKMPDQGGTHASPRLHDVRGHWVTRNGKRFWRKAHQRGDASLGVVFHDYKLKGEVNEHAYE